MNIKDALIIVNNFSKGVKVDETELRKALPVVIVYAEMMVEQDDKYDKAKHEGEI